MERKPSRPLNLDAAGVPRVADEVVAAMTPWLGEAGARAEGLHAHARRARRALDDARQALGALVGASPDRVIFTSGAAESVLHVVRASAARSRPAAATLACPANETALVAAAVRTVARERGREAVTLPVERSGRVRVDAIEDASSVCALSWAHPVLGAIQDVEDLARRLARAGGVLAVDATWLLGRRPIRLAAFDGEVALFADLAPIGVPFGIGVSFVPEGLEVPPLFPGGLEQEGRRAGAVPVALAVAAGVAARRVARDIDRRATALRAASRRLADALARLPGVVLLGPAPEARIPGHVAAAVPGLRGDALALALSDRGVLASPGSPCAEAGTPDTALLASGLSEAQARAAIVLGMPAEAPLATADIDEVVAAFAASVTSLRFVAGARG